jgi:hypothetical protein
LDAPLPLSNFRLNAIVPKVSMMDAGLAWVFDQLAEVKHAVPRRHKRSPSRKRLS